MTTRLSEVVSTSRDVAATAGRLEKIARLAERLRSLASDEVEIAVALLSGGPRQGRIGLGWSNVELALGDASAVPEPPLQLSFEDAALGTPAEAEPAEASRALTLIEVDQALGRIASCAGRGASRERARLLAAFSSRHGGGA